MSRLAMVAVAVSAHLCALRTARRLQSLVFDCDDPLSVAALICQLGAALVVLTVELGSVFFLTTGELSAFAVLDHQKWDPAALAFVGIILFTALVHLFVPAHKLRKDPGRTHQ